MRGMDTVKAIAVRLVNPVAERTGEYAFYVRVPDELRRAKLQVMIVCDGAFDGVAERLRVAGMWRR